MNKKMFRGRRFGVAAVSAALLMSTVAIGSAEAQSLTILHNFNSFVGDGSVPYGGVVRDAAGNLYGTTFDGGSASRGVVFRLDASGNNYAVLHTFLDGSYPNDGLYPTAGLTIDSSGHLYGTTRQGGSEYGGTVFRIDTSGNNYTVLHNFVDYIDFVSGAFPLARLILDSAGHLYGTTLAGGRTYSGIVFKLDTSGDNFTVLHSFGVDPRDGNSPNSALTLDSSGNLYGTTPETVFKLDTSGNNYTVLHHFSDGTVAGDGTYPLAELALGPSGQLYGTTQRGGSSGVGVVFKLDTSGGNYSVVHNFGDGTVENDGQYPAAGLILGPSGNLYGTTSGGGSPGNNGSVFKLDPSGQVTIVHRFRDGTVPNDGGVPLAGLTVDAVGNLYGTTAYGGTAGGGTVFKLRPYLFSGFLPPIDTPPITNTGKAGRTYPVKWRLSDSYGTYVSALSAVTSITYQSVSCSTFTGNGTDELNTTATGGSSLRYDTTAGQYIYNWATPSTAGCYVLKLNLDSGQSFTANFQLN